MREAPENHVNPAARGRNVRAILAGSSIGKAAMEATIRQQAHAAMMRDLDEMSPPHGLRTGRCVCGKPISKNKAACFEHAVE